MGCDYSVILRENGMRVTAPRVAILAVLDEFPHSDAEFIKDKVIERLGTVSIQAVYDTLNSLSHSGILHRVEPKGIRAVYEIDEGDNHHHFVCRRCHTLESVRCTCEQVPCTHPDIASDYFVDEAEIMYWGYCKECAKILGL